MARKRTKLDPAAALEARETKKKLGQRIRELRAKKEWSQEAFAAACGLYRSHMGAIERGEANITLATLLAIAEKLDTTVSTLFKGIR